MYNKYIIINNKYIELINIRKWQEVLEWKPGTNKERLIFQACLQATGCYEKK